MDHARVSRLDIDRLDETMLGCFIGDDEVPIVILSLRSKRVFLWHFDDQIGFALRPIVVELGRRRHVRYVAFGSPLLDPLRDQFDLFIGKTEVVAKVTDRR